jgi:hypothetical protein
MFVTYLPFPQQLHDMLLKILEQYQAFSDKCLVLVHITLYTIQSLKKK